jgi:hypothetical protein
MSSIECGSGGELERGRDLGQGCLLALAYLDAAEAEKTAFLGGLGDPLGCGPQPCLEGGGILGRLGVEKRAKLAQRLDLRWA